MENTPHKVIFMGTPAFAVPSLQALMNSDEFDIALVVTQPDKPVGRNRKLQPSSIKELALENNLEVANPESVKNNPDFINKVKQINPDVIVVVAYGKILPQELLDIPKMGAVNIHASLLPKYRGASPVVWSILNGDTKTGVTLMKLDAKMDTGPTIATSPEINIEPNDTSATLSKKIAQIGSELLVNNLGEYIKGDIAPKAQDDTLATYVGLIKKTDGLINWQEPAEIIERKIRAYTPWPGCFIKFNNKVLKILEAEVISDAKNKIGDVWQAEDKYPAVTTQDKSLKLITVQPEGKKPMSAKDFILGNSSFIGSELG